MTMLVLFFFVIDFEEVVGNHWGKNGYNLMEKKGMIYRRARDNYIFLTTWEYEKEDGSRLKDKED